MPKWMIQMMMMMKKKHAIRKKIGILKLNLIRYNQTMRKVRMTVKMKKMKIMKRMMKRMRKMMKKMKKKNLKNLKCYRKDLLGVKG